MIAKMKFVSLSGPKADIDRMVNKYLSKYEIHLENALTALGEYLGLIPQGIGYECSVAFNDGIIEDHDKVIDNNIKLVEAGLQSRLGAIMEIYECDEETAEKRLERINAENVPSVYDFKEDDPNGTESS